jgi:hypothetical protein
MSNWKNLIRKEDYSHEEEAERRIEAPWLYEDFEDREDSPYKEMKYDAEHYEGEIRDLLRKLFMQMDYYEMASGEHFDLDSAMNDIAQDIGQQKYEAQYDL